MMIEMRVRGISEKRGDVQRDGVSDVRRGFRLTIPSIKFFLFCYQTLWNACHLIEGTYHYCSIDYTLLID